MSSSHESAQSLERVFPVRPGEVIPVEPQPSHRARLDRGRLFGVALVLVLSAAVATGVSGREVAEFATPASAAVLCAGMCVLWRRRGERAVPAALVTGIGAVGLLLDGTASTADDRLAPLAALWVLGTACTLLCLVVIVRPRRRERDRVVEAIDAHLFRRVVDGMGDVVALVDGDLRFRYVSPAVAHAFGHDPDALVGEPLERLVGATASPLHEAFRRAAMRHGHAVRVDWEMLDGDGRRRAVESTVASRLNDPVLCAYVVTARDASERIALERQLRDHAFADPLTGVANRALLFNRAERALTRASDRGHSIGVIVVDLDGFRQMNETLGRPAGDYMLSVIAQRISDVAGPHHTVGRHGGDEFALVLEDLDDDGTLHALVGRLVEELRVPISFGANEYVLSVSVGSALSDEASSVESLLEEAAIALFSAKSAGGDEARHFTPSMRPSAIGRLDLEAALRHGLDRGEFELFYQPSFDVATGKIANFEALLRWRRPGFGLVVPDEFVGFAEERGLMIEIGRWVLRRALEQLKEFAAHASNPELAVSVNLSSSQLADPQLASDVRVALAASGFEPHRLILEVAESALAHRPGDVVTQLERLHDVGVRLAVDDFGTGHATLSFLQELPIDMLKIDRSFVRAGAEAPGRGVLEAIVRLAQTLSLTTVAEGAEERGQLEVLVALGCDMVQGYLLGHPISAAEAAVIAGRRAADEASVSPFLGSWLQRHVIKETERSLS